MKRSTGSDTGSRRKKRLSLRFKLFIAIIVVALVCVAASAVLAGYIARSQIRRYGEEIEGSPGWRGPKYARGEALRGVTLGFFFAGLLAVLLALLLSIFLADRISKPLSELTDATGSMADGNYAGRLDISGGAEIEELADAFNTLSENLEQNEELRKNMVADIAHELRNPLATIHAQLEAIEDGVIEADKSAIDSLMEDTVLLTRLVEDLQQLSIVEAGRLELNLVRVDPGEMVRGVASRFEQDFVKKGISLELDVAGELPLVKADQLRLAQVLGNLVKNSLLHTPEGGEITVRAASSEGEVVFSVADTGSGINEEELPMIFERFYRTDRSRTRATGGAGLGLCIARSLVEAQGGHIRAESERGKGTTISFTVPAFMAEPDS